MPTVPMILLVHFRAPTLRIMALTLSAAGPVITAADAAHAKALLAEHDDVSLLVSSVELPDGSGPELAHQFREMHDDSDRKVLLVSAYGRPPDDSSDAFLPEPLDPERLLEVAASLVGVGPAY